MQCGESRDARARWRGSAGFPISPRRVFRARRGGTAHAGPAGLEAAQGGWAASLEGNQGRPENQGDSGDPVDFVQGRVGHGGGLPAGSEQLHPEAGELRGISGSRTATWNVLAAAECEAAGQRIPEHLGAGSFMSEANSRHAAVRSRPLRILIAEDSEEDLELTRRELNKSGLDVEIDTVSTREAFTEKIRTHTVDMVLSDYRMPGWTGMDAFTEIVKSGQDIPLILVTGTLGDLKAVECIQIGMADYVLKQQLARLPMAILRAQEGKLLRDAQKETAAALREGEARFRLLVENAPDAIVVLDLDSKMFSACNENALRLFRLTREELMRWGPGELRPPFQPDGRP